MKRFDLMNLNEVEGKEKYHAEISYKFEALEDLDTEVEINAVWEINEFKRSYQLRSNMKNAIFWDVMPGCSCKNRRFGGTWRLHHQGHKNL
jgi:hypothetical protein